MRSSSFTGIVSMSLSAPAAVAQTKSTPVFRLECIEPKEGKKPDKLENEVNYDTDLDIEEEKQEFDMTGRSQYLLACELYGIVPASYFLRHMTDPDLIMHHHSLGKKGVKAIALALQDSTSVLKLDLEDNMMEGEGGQSIASILKDNCYISELNISNNCLRTKGAVALGEMLMSNTTLQILNISGNQFKDEDGVYLAKSLYENFSLRVLNASNNELSEETAKCLAPALKENDSLEELDLSYNHFRTKGAHILCTGIKDHQRLERVNLSYNGLGNEGAVGIAAILKESQRLKELDVSATRIGNAGALVIAEALKQNELLKTLKIGYNPLGLTGAMAILKAIGEETSHVELLDLTFVEVNKDFVALKNALVESKQLTVKHGYVLGDYVIKVKTRDEETVEVLDDSPDQLFGMPIKDVNASNLLSSIRLRAEEKSIELIEYLCEVDPLNVHKVVPSDIMKVLEKASIGCSNKHKPLIAGLLKELSDDDGLVCYSQLVVKKKH